MIADFQAHASHLSEMRLKKGLPGYFEMAAQGHGTAPPPRNEAALTPTDTIFNEIKAALVGAGIDLLGTAKVAQKKDCWQLMIADFQAHASHLSEMRLKKGLPGYFEMAAQRHGTAPPPRNEAALTQIEHNAASLRMLKTQWEERKRARMERWRAAHGRAAKADGDKSEQSPTMTR
jgi:hypothetical protein